ncbi:MAG: nicotinate (nicotinamide) nucleotide adenylyltransferase [Spirochaetia bacterium]|nr:nicotinate (nicotinamide) nucleotide adenylyltransferase [Spirochaetia bacterium]
MKTIIFGGTFNPIHLGHLYLIHAIASQSDYERIIVIPTLEPPHKEYIREISDQDRLELIHKGIDDYYHIYREDRKIEILIDTLEIDRGGKSYMYDTVIEMYRKYEITGTLAIAIGDDLLPSLESWYRFEDLVSIVYFVVVHRLEKNKIDFPKNAHGEYILVEPFPCSSTSIREMLGSAKSSLHTLTSLLSETVLDYIIDYELYQRH